MAEMKTLNGYEIVDAKAREDVSKLSSEIGDLSELSAYGTSVVEILKKLIAGGTITPDEEETLSNALAVVKLSGDIGGISADNYVNVICEFNDTTNNISFTDYAEIAWQGSGSLSYSNIVDGVDVAKNIKIKLYSDEERTVKNKRVFKDWHETNNFHLKCNYADATNIMNNLMMHYITKSYQYLTPLPRDGARYTVDGFPVLLYINDVFAGIRFWNLKQDDKVYNLNEEIVDESGSVTQEADLCYQIGRNNGTNEGTNSGAFIYGNLSSYGNTFSDAHEEIDWYWEDRVWDKVSDHPSVLYDTIQWVSEASDEEFKTNLSQYFDVEYLINYFVIMYVCGMIDSKGKNFNMLYFPDKGVWYATFLDMDNAFGTNYGVSKTSYNVELSQYGCPRSRLFDKLFANFKDEIIAHYQKLRQTFFTTAELEDSIDQTLLNVSASWLAENFEVKYGNTSYSPIIDPKTYILNWANQRFGYMDTVLVNEELVPTTKYVEGFINDNNEISTDPQQIDVDYVSTEYTDVSMFSGQQVTVSSCYAECVVRVAEYDENKNFIKRSYSSAKGCIVNSYTLKLDDATKYLRIGFRINNYMYDITNEMLVEIFDNIVITSEIPILKYFSGYLKSDNTIEEDDKKHCYTDYIYLGKMDGAKLNELLLKIKGISNVNLVFRYYDIDKNFIGTSTSQYTSEASASIPTTARYVRLVLYYSQLIEISNNQFDGEVVYIGNTDGAPYLLQHGETE